MRSDAKARPDFIVEGEAKIKRLSMQLPASGLVVTKYALNGWTIKCIDRATGEEIYYNTKLPAGEGSWASEEEALKAIGTRIASEFSRDFFLQHVYVTGRKVVLKVDGLPAAVTDDVLRRELTGMPSVLTVAPAAAPHAFEMQLAGSGPATDLVMVGHPEAAERQARPGVLCAWRERRRRGGGHLRREVQRSCGARPAGDESAGGPVRRPGRAAACRRQEPRHAQEADDLTSAPAVGAGEAAGQRTITTGTCACSDSAATASPSAAPSLRSVSVTNTCVAPSVFA